jgi:hypothetical protein
MIAALLLIAAAPEKAPKAAPVPVPAQASSAEEDAVIAAWATCLQAQADRLAAASREPAATIADGALGLCNDRQAAVQQLYVRISGANSLASGVWIDRHVEQWRRRLIGSVLDQRSRPIAPPPRKKR